MTSLKDDVDLFSQTRNMDIDRRRLSINASNQAVCIHFCTIRFMFGIIAEMQSIQMCRIQFETRTIKSNDLKETGKNMFRTKT